MSACLVDCKERLIASTCGCRDVYMPANQQGQSVSAAMDGFLMVIVVNRSLNV